MQINVDSKDQFVTVTPVGEVDLSCSPELQQRLRETLSSRPKRVVVDLEQVPYMDSSGVATLVEAMKIARQQSTRFVLCCMQDKVRSIFEIARLDRVFTITSSAEEASAV